MRTTIDLPDDVHRAASLIARDRGQTLGRTVGDLVRRALSTEPSASGVTVDVETGLPQVWIGRTVTAEDVAAAQDEV